MMFRYWKTVGLAALLTIIFAPGDSLAKNPADYVDPMIGTSTSRWMLYPGPSMPFGMVKLSPDNQNQGWKAGYEYNIETISGFSHIHSWVMGGVLVMPTMGELEIKPGDENKPDEGYRSRFRHETEVAKVGYYAVTLDDDDIRAELSATKRAGFHRYTFPQSGEGRILFDLKIPTEYGYELEWANIRKVNDREIAGFSKQFTYDGFSSLLNEYTVHFVAQFNQPFKSMGGWDRDNIFQDVDQVVGRGDAGGFVRFDVQKEKPIVMKVGISLVSIDQARLNLKTETRDYGFDFDAVRKNG